MRKLSIERLRELFKVCPNSPSGVAAACDRKRGPTKEGHPVITNRCPRGYYIGRYTDGTVLPDRSNVYTLSAHRVVFALVHGYWPEEVDHIDRNKSNNSPANLRAATRQQNSRNKGMRRDNTSGVTGVQYRPKTSKRNPWHVKSGGLHIGSYATKEEAVAARNKYVEETFGAFAPGACA